jgi:hypothetical protein
LYAHMNNKTIKILKKDVLNYNSEKLISFTTDPPQTHQ